MHLRIIAPRLASLHLVAASPTTEAAKESKCAKKERTVIVAGAGQWDLHSLCQLSRGTPSERYPSTTNYSQCLVNYNNTANTAAASFIGTAGNCVRYSSNRNPISAPKSDYIAYN